MCECGWYRLDSSENYYSLKTISSVSTMCKCARNIEIKEGVKKENETVHKAERERGKLTNSKQNENAIYLKHKNENLNTRIKISWK